MEVDAGSAKVRALTHIYVDSLFGRYTYNIPGNDSDELDPQLTVLYGENGAGKTTILKLLHNAISSGKGRGHKTEILPVPFKTFVASFAGDIKIEVKRPEVSDGSYDMSLRVGRNVQAKAHFRSIDGAIPTSSPYSDEQDAFIEKVDEILKVNSYFLADERKLESDVFGDDDDDASPELVDIDTYRLMLQRRLNDRYAARDGQLILALRRALQWVRPQALTGANIGSLNTNTIYADVVKRISLEPEVERSIEAQASATDIRKVINELALRAKNQSQFGLTSELETRDLLTSFKGAPAERRPLIISLLQPYLDGIRARLDAMEGLYLVLKAFTESLNGFLLDKEVTFDVQRGLVVWTSDGSRLAPERLSSGEKHLLMLLCNLLISRQHPSLFLVDEPELSLNVKWQRKLVPALLSSTAGSQIQLLMATHSIELLSSYRERVVRLPFGSE